MRALPALVAFALAAASSSASAGEVFGGIYIHDVDTPLTKSGIEDGVDLQLGYRWAPLGGRERGAQPYLFVSANTAGETHYAAAGLSWKLGDEIYIRPGIGLAIHTGSASKRNRSDRIAFGSRVLFEPELAIGARVSERATIEASWIHMSHAQIFSRQNPGIDNFGLRLNFAL